MTTEAQRKKILVCSDAAYPMHNTGFAVVTAQLMRGLMERFAVVHLARGLRDFKDLPFPNVWAPPASDPNGYAYVATVIQNEKPDLIVFEADPGSILEWRKNPEVRGIPNLVHTPVEGAPLLAPWSTAMAEIVLQHGRITCYTDFSKRTIEKSINPILQAFSDENTQLGAGRIHMPAVEVLPLGIDHADFERDSHLRAETRTLLDWEDKFIVMNVARNAGRKGWPRLFKAIQLLQDQYPQVHLYAHTVPFENFFLHGHNLFGLRDEYGLQNRVIFKKDLLDPYHGLPFDGEGLTLKALYNAADLFVAPSGGEGWNLPLWEAARCGLPVAHTRYSGGWEVAREFAWPLSVTDYTTIPTGMDFAEVSPHEIAWMIEFALRHPQEMWGRAQIGLQKAKAQRWAPTVERFAQIAEEMLL